MTVGELKGLLEGYAATDEVRIRTTYGQDAKPMEVFPERGIIYVKGYFLKKDSDEVRAPKGRKTKPVLQVSDGKTVNVRKGGRGRPRKMAITDDGSLVPIEEYRQTLKSREKAEKGKRTDK